MTPDEILQAIEKFRIAYNSADVPTLEGLLSESVKWGHRNRFKGEGRAELLRSIAEFSDKAPGRYFANFGRTAVHDQVVFAEQTWHATPVNSDPAWGWEKGVPFSMETCSVFAFQGGRIVEWSDFG